MFSRDKTWRCQTGFISAGTDHGSGRCNDSRTPCPSGGHSRRQWDGRSNWSRWNLFRASKEHATRSKGTQDALKYPISTAKIPYYPTATHVRAVTLLVHLAWPVAAGQNHNSLFRWLRVRPCMKIATNLPRAQDPPEHGTRRSLATATTGTRRYIYIYIILGNTGWFMFFGVPSANPRLQFCYLFSERTSHLFFFLSFFISHSKMLHGKFTPQKRSKMSMSIFHRALKKRDVPLIRHGFFHGFSMFFFYGFSMFSPWISYVSCHKCQLFAAFQARYPAGWSHRAGLVACGAAPGGLQRARRATGQSRDGTLRRRWNTADADGIWGIYKVYLVIYIYMGKL